MKLLYEGTIKKNPIMLLVYTKYCLTNNTTVFGWQMSAIL